MKFGKVILAVFLSLGLVFSSVLDLCADETGGLILKLLVKKGIISQKEANELTAEAKKLEMAAPSEEAMAKHVHKASWAERIKLKGDVRLRNEYQRPGTGPYVNRQRIRARAALEAKLTDTVKAGIGIASGGTGIGSARSTNQTLSQAFSTKPIGLDLAYVDWKPIKNIRLTGGKYKNPL
ncbi:MAG: putative porin, partial [Candidatus Omnitrophota bacterium]